MKKNQIQSIVMHIDDDRDSNLLYEKINEFHVDVIERRLNQSDLMGKQKVCIIDRVIDNLKLRELNGVIK